MQGTAGCKLTLGGQQLQNVWPWGAVCDDDGAHGWRKRGAGQRSEQGFGADALANGVDPGLLGDLVGGAQCATAVQRD